MMPVAFLPKVEAREKRVAEKGEPNIATARHRLGNVKPRTSPPRGVVGVHLKINAAFVGGKPARGYAALIGV